MGFAIEVGGEFCASHQLRLPASIGGGLEPLHGHNFRVTVRVESPRLDALETVMDFHPLEASLRRILQGWNNRHLNEIPPFDAAVNPSAERIAERLGQLLAPEIPAPARLAEVRITEAPGCLAIWKAE